MQGVKGSSLGLVGLVGLAWVFAGGGCDSGPSAAEVAMACDDYCEKYIAASCASGFKVDLAACKAQECVDASSRSADCREGLKDYYDCLSAQPDICAEGTCTNEVLSVLLFCGNR